MTRDQEDRIIDWLAWATVLLAITVVVLRAME